MHIQATKDELIDYSIRTVRLDTNDEAVEQE